MTFFWHDWCGYVGVLLVLLAFLLLQSHKLHGNGIVYQLMNLFGALGVMLSLLFGGFNLAAFVMELSWLLISIYGIGRSLRLRRELRASGRDPGLV